MLEGIATSDWHFMGLKKHFENHIKYSIEEIDKIYKYALSEGVAHIFVAGDISDTPILSYDCYIELLRFAKKYDGRINTHYICGNHDFSDIRSTSMDLMSFLQELDLFETFNIYMKPTQKVIDEVTVNFLPFPCLDSIESKNPCLNFSHVTYNGAIGDNGRKIRTKKEFIQDPRDFNISGHIHQYQLLKTKRALYCGNPYQKTFGESLPKGFVHFKAVQVSKKDPLKFVHKFVNNNPAMRLINVTISSLDDLSKLSDSDRVRYKLIIEDELSGGVKLPSSVFSEYRNIADIVYKSKKVKENQQESSIYTRDSRTSVRSGLTNYLKSLEFDKAMLKKAHNEVKKAVSDLNIT